MDNPVLSEAEEASSLLEMARQLHQQHVTAAKVEAASILEKANDQAKDIVWFAETERDRIKSESINEHERLQKSVAELKSFESAYRGAIEGYLAGLLTEIRPASLAETPATLAIESEKPVEYEESFNDLTSDDSVVIDTEAAFNQDDLDSDAFDKLAEPNSSAEEVDVVTELPQTEAIEIVESDYKINEDAIDELLAAQDEADLEKDEEVAEKSTEQESESIESLLESIADLKGTEVDNDGGSTVDGIDDDPEVTIPDTSASISFEEMFGSNPVVVEDEPAAVEDSSDETEKEVVEQQVEEIEEDGVVDPITTEHPISDEHDPDHKDDKKPSFNFFGKK